MTTTMEIERTLSEIARLKAQAKTIERNIETLQGWLMGAADSEGFELPKNYATPFGLMVKNERQNYSTVDSAIVIKQAGQAFFNKCAETTVSKIKKVGGEVMYDKLLAKGAFSVGRKSIFYTLKEK